MGEGNQTLTSTWNGCPPSTVACPGRPFVCAPLDGSRTVQQLCEDKDGPFRCPDKQTFCGYRRDANGAIVKQFDHGPDAARYYLWTKRYEG